MTSREFCYWLQGFFEIAGAGYPSDGPPRQLSEQQVKNVQKHLALVFRHEIDPSYPDQAALNEIHNPPATRPPTGDTKLRC